MAKRRRFPSFFDDDFDPFADMEQFHAMFDELMRRGLDQSLAKPGQPLVYGFSMHVGPDGKPRVEHFGNVRQGKVSQEREPLVDLVDLPNEVRVVAELPGVSKDAITINVQDGILSLSVNDPERPFSKRVQLPAAVEEKSANASYKNGILEVVLKKKPQASKGRVHVR